MMRRLAMASLVLAAWCVAAQAKKLNSDMAASGLREALVAGTDTAVTSLGKPDGYLLDKEVRIEVPGDLRSVAKVMRGLGQGALVDEFETSMNRAAESAVPTAKHAFIAAIKEMHFKDVWNVLTGGEHAATDYLREHAGPKLTDAFRPIVKEKLDEVGATRDFDALVDRIAALPFGGGKPVFELDAYVTERALDGLFLKVEREEEAIRKNPIKRGTALLRKVFGSKEAKKALAP